MLSQAGVQFSSWSCLEVSNQKGKQEIGLFVMDINALMEETAIKDDHGTPDLTAMEWSCMCVTHQIQAINCMSKYVWEIMFMFLMALFLITEAF